MQVTEVLTDRYNREIVKLTAVCQGSTCPEDNTFAKATPSADITMTIDNPEAQGILKAGRFFFVDFTRVKEVAAAAVALLAMVALLGFGAGCTTATVPGANGQPATTVPTLDTNAVITGINAVVPVAVRLAVQKDTNCGPYLKQAAIIFRAAAMRGDFDPLMIQQSLASISIKELRTDEAALAEQAGLALYQAYVAQVVSAKLDQVVWLRPVLDALSRAIVQGLPPN